MINTQITRDEFTALIDAVWTSTVETPRAKTIKVNPARELRRLMWTADTNANVRGTRWAAYQAVTEYLDHTAPIAIKMRQSEARAERALTSSLLEATKVRAFGLLAS